MNIPIWLVLIAPPVIMALGLFVGGALALSKLSDEESDEETDLWIARHNEGVFRARNQKLIDISRSQQSIKSGRIIDVLEG